MATQSFNTGDIRGLTPAVDPTKSDDIFVLDGRNFVFDSIGPKSYFGNQLLSQIPLRKPAETQSIRLKLPGGDRSFYFTSDSVLEWNEDELTMAIIYGDFDTSGNQYRWTCAYVNRFIYFAHPSVGLLAYSLDSGLCFPAAAVGIGVPENAVACADNNGRLNVLAGDLLHWSAPANGLDFNPALGFAGFQLISGLVNGEPIMTVSYPSGCLTWTSGGAMRSEFRGDQAVYRHRAISTQYRPVNSFSVIEVNDDQIVILDERGLFMSQGESVTPYNAVFNEFFIRYVKDNNLEIGNFTRLEWDEINKHLYLSVSLSQYSTLYDHSFVLYPDLDKWGFFAEKHYGIVPLEIRTGSRLGSYQGYIDEQGYIRFFTDQASVDSNLESLAQTHNADFQPGLIQPETNIDLEVSATLVSSMNQFSCIPRANRPQGFYQGDALVPIAPILQGLNSYVLIGWYKFGANSSVDDLTEITELKIRTTREDNSGDGFGGFNIVGDDGGLVLPTGIGAAIPTQFHDQAYLNHGLTVLSSVDGGDSFSDVIPVVVSLAKTARYYALSSVGLYHALRFEAIEVGDAFRPSCVSLTVVYAGKLQ